MSPKPTNSVVWLFCISFALFAAGVFLSRGIPDGIKNSHTIDSTAIRSVSNSAGPELSGFWSEPPDIKICSDVHVKKSRIETAVRFWTRLGYEFGRVYVDDSGRYDPLGCLAEPGEITFLVPPQDLKFYDDKGTHFLAITRTYRVAYTSEIIAAGIFVESESDYTLERIIEHELGHALGWLHHESSYHIMHSVYLRTGHRTAGVHHNDYIAFTALLIADEGLSVQP